MRRLSLAVIALALSSVACRPRDKIQLEPVEHAASLVSVVDAGDPEHAVQFVHGFHRIEENSWRWTEGRFAVLLKPPAGSERQGANLAVNVSVPEAVLSKTGPLTLTATVNEGSIGQARFTTPGEHTFEAEIPPAQTDTEALTVEFMLDRYLPAGTADSRELGVIVSRVALESR